MLELELSLDLEDLVKLSLYRGEKTETQRSYFVKHIHRIGNGEGKMHVR